MNTTLSDRSSCLSTIFADDLGAKHARSADHNNMARRSRWISRGLGVLGLLSLWMVVPRAHAQASDQWFVQTGGASHHFEQTRAPGRSWNETHPGLGIERRKADDLDWSVRYTGGVMQDSRFVWGGYAGAAYLREWSRGKDFQLGVGAGAYAFYRSVSWDGRMALIPGVLPTMSLGLMDNRVGVNLLYVPKVSAYGQAMPPVIYGQLTMRFR